MLDISLINPYIRIATLSVLGAKSELNMRIIFDYELIYIEYGEFILTYDGVEYLCKKGDFVLLRPGIPHSFSSIKSELSQPHIHFDITHIADSEEVPVSFKDRNALTEKEKSWIREDVFSDYPSYPFVFFEQSEKVLEIFYEIVSPSDISPLLKKAKLTQIIDLLISNNFQNIFKPNPSYPIEKQIKDYIDAGQGFTDNLDDIAKQFSYSKYYLEHCFKKSYGIGIMVYRNNRRMLSAKEMLKYDSVSSVSEKLGFSSVFVFSRAFKKYFNESPSEIKKQKDCLAK